MVTREKWDKGTAAQLSYANNMKRDGISGTARLTWELPDLLTDKDFDKTGKHEFSLRMRLSRAGLSKNRYRNWPPRSGTLVGE